MLKLGLVVYAIASYSVASTFAFPRSEGTSNNLLQKRAPSPDNTCGNQFSGNNKGYSCAVGNEGPCCSQYGWCGATEAYCGNGCQAAFGSCSETPTITTTSTTAAPTPTSIYSDDFTCGSTKGGKSCTPGYCCSVNGWCGNTAAYCESGCQKGFGMCSGNLPTDPADPDPTIPAENGNIRCGPQYGNKVCGGNDCCSPAGYCGVGEEYCQAPDCLRGFGKCDSDITPPGASTADILRPILGKVPFGVDIFDCKEPGTIALTYDDGPFVYTNDLLDVLAEHGAKATFFVTGINLGKGRIDDASKPWPAMINRMVEDGHQIASHTWSHADLSTLNNADRKLEMVKLEMALRNLIGKFPTYMRPPYSSCNAACMDTMKELGYHVTYFDLDTEDYLHTLPSTQQISKNIIHSFLSTADAETDDYLSIMHDIHDQTVHNLTAYFLTELTNKGFRAVTVGECLGDAPQNWYRSASGAPEEPITTTTKTTSSKLTSTTTITTTTRSRPTSTKTTTKSTTTKGPTSTSTKKTSTTTTTKKITSSTTSVAGVTTTTQTTTSAITSTKMPTTSTTSSVPTLTTTTTITTVTVITTTPTTNKAGTTTTSTTIAPPTTTTATGPTTKTATTSTKVEELPSSTTKTTTTTPYTTTKSTTAIPPPPPTTLTTITTSTTTTPPPPPTTLTTLTTSTITTTPPPPSSPPTNSTSADLRQSRPNLHTTSACTTYSLPPWCAAPISPFTSTITCYYAYAQCIGDVNKCVELTGERGMCGVWEREMCVPLLRFCRGCGDVEGAGGGTRGCDNLGWEQGVRR